MPTIDHHISPGTLRTLDWPSLIEALSSLVSSPFGRERCQAPPWIEDRASVEQILDETEELKCHLEQGGSFPISGAHDIRSHLKRVKKEGILKPSELLEIASTLRAVNQCRNYLRIRRDSLPLNKDRTGSLADLDDLQVGLEESFDPSGEISDRASPELGDLRRKARALHAEIIEKVDRLLLRPQYEKVLQDRYYTIKADRYVVPVKVEARHRLRGIVHDSSASGATLFIEPQEIVDLNNRLKIAKLDVEHEERLILQDLSGRVLDRSNEISGALEAIGDLDYALARARLAQRLKAHRPQINTEGVIDLIQVRHPLLELTVPRVVPNDVCLGRGFRTLIITGPNTGGKTVTLKTLGLSVIMVRAGMLLPASPDSTVSLFDQVFADIGDEQSVMKNLSTFSAHVGNIISILDRCSPGALVLLDEIIIGTDPTEGASLARALLEDLTRIGARTAVTTHYSELKGLAATQPAFRNACVEFDAETLQPTYHLITGVPGKSSAINIARRLGMPEDVLSRAIGLYGSGHHELDKLIDDLQRERAGLASERLGAEAQRCELEETVQRYRTKLGRLEENKDKLLAARSAALEKVFKEAKADVADVVRELQASPSPNKARHARRRIISLEQAQSERVDGQIRDGARHHEPIDWGEAAPGQAVLIASIHQTGILLTLPDRKGMVSVQVGAGNMSCPKKMRCPKEEIAQAPSPPPSGPVCEGRSVESIAGEIDATGERELHNTCDLRGETVEEALDRTEAFLDQTILGPFPRAFIIHGHGTGALKKAIRAYLENSPYVKSFRPGERSEGGDGITVVELRE